MYNIMIIERFVIGLILVFTYSLKYSLIIMIVIFLILSVFTVIIQPFKYMRHNIRFIINMLITIIVLSIYTFYKFQTIDNQNKQKISFYLPIIVCILLLICIVYSAVFMIYEIYLKCMKCSSDSKQN